MGDIDTRDIILEQVVVDDFWELENVWNRDRKITKKDVYARVRNPVRDTDYERLLTRLLHIPQSSAIRVHDGDNWQEAFTSSGIPLATIHRFAEIAETTKSKRYFLEVILRLNGDNAYIDFRKRGDEIVGYSVRTSYLAKDLFTLNMRKERAFAYANGIWVPEQAAPETEPAKTI